MEAGRICTKEGCDRPAKGRGMCSSHYMKWHRANPGINVMRNNEAAVLAAMPGTIGDLIERSGLLWKAVRRALAVLRENDQARIGGFKAPVQAADKWRPIYMAGAGRDAVLTPERKREHAAALRRIARNKKSGYDAPSRKKKATSFSQLFEGAR